MKLTAALAVAVSLILAPTATAAVKAKVALVRAANGVQIEVRLTSKKAFTRATRPRAVRVTAGANAYKLKRVKSTRKASTWRSPVQTGTAATTLEGLGGDRVKIRVSTKRGKATVRGKVKALPPAPPTTPPPTSGPQLVRDDAAGQAAINAGDLLLEWYQFGASGQTAEFLRIWLLQDGSFRQENVDYNSVSGEICNSSVTGSWTFKEGYTTTYNGGGVVVKLTFSLSNGQTGDDVLAFPNGSDTVYVGTQSVPYERNPQIVQKCP